MTFPYPSQVSWDAVPGATGYEVRLNGTLVGATSALTLPVPLPAAGTYTVGVTAVSPFESGPEGTLSFNIIAVGKPGNIKIR